MTTKSTAVEDMAVIASIAGALSGAAIVLFLWGDRSIYWAVAILAAWFWAHVWGGVSQARALARVLQPGKLTDAEVAHLLRFEHKTQIIMINSYLHRIEAEESKADHER
jgi:hypothetical protein